MNTRKSLLAAAAAFFATAAVSFADVNIVLTGSTAFRGAVNASIKTMLPGATIRYVAGTSSGLDASSYAIFQGTHTSLGTVTIQTSWSGSGTGITALVNSTAVSVLPLSVLSEGTAGTEATTTTTRVTAQAQMAFSDVKQEATTAASLSQLPAPASVGIVPFIFVANDGSPAGITNITDQQFYLLNNAGFTTASLFTGVATDTLPVYPIGRDAGSGTRITVLAETGYGINNAVNNADIVASGLNGTLSFGPQTDATWGNGGESSGATLATELGCTSTDFAVIGYLGLSDASTAKTNGARWLKYNGSDYTADNVKNGVYTLWCVEQLYFKQGLSSATANNQTGFKTALLSAVDTYLVNNETKGIAVSKMNVSRPSDGGPVSTL